MNGKGYSIRSGVASDRRGQYDLKVASIAGSRRILFTDDKGWMPVRVTTKRSYHDVSRWLEGLDIEGFLFAGKVANGLWQQPLDTLGSITEKVGVVEAKGKTYLYPFRFVELRRNRRLIAKMLTSYFNSEMVEAAPTMELLEVVKGERRKGIGTAMIRLAEGWAVDEGFDRIWGTDAELSMGLLLKLGYENDLEECVKYF
ncbi:MAG: GNAT family N-acetyltransferase [Nitrososphaerota archaeon]|nr:GNAT family N-acetyltransferase [Nitrososphaerota archaeon]